MITRELELMLANFSGYQRGEIEQRIRPLRDRNLIPSGPRGVNAPDLEPLHAALVLLTMVARRATDAGAVAMRAMDLKSVSRDGCALQGGTSLLPVISTALAGAIGYVERVEILCDGSLAWVTINEDGTAKRVLFTDDAKMRRRISSNPDVYDRQGAMFCGHRLVLTEAILEQVALDLVDDTPAGYAKERAAQ